jgi:hypothetical protein
MDDVGILTEEGKMKISSHDISIYSDHKYVEKSESESKIKAVFFNGSDEENEDSDSIDISQEAKSRFFNEISYKSEGITRIKNIGNDITSLNEADKNFIKEIVSKTSNIKIDITEESANINQSQRQRPDLGRLADVNNAESIMVSFSHSNKREVSELTMVNSGGVVTTQDGREITFGLHLEMERNFSSEVSGNSIVGLNELIDPLVIQLESGPPSLSDKVFSFDLNNDGEDEVLRSLGKGSGFLAFDINNDGKINDGSELFGTRSGNGFEDLAKYDDDKNGWIDENDEIFSKLSIWRPETDGEAEYMSGLLSADVGAIYLGYGSSEHTMTDEKGKVLGQLKSTGMYLKESGEASQVYQMDLANLKNKTPDLNRGEEVLMGNLQESLSPEESKLLSFRNALITQLDKFKESFAKQANTSVSRGNIWQDLADSIRERIEQIIEMLEGDKEEGMGYSSNNQYFDKNRFNKIDISM